MNSAKKNGLTWSLVASSWVVAGGLTGCTTYVRTQPARVVYVQPPPVYVEPPRVYVAPPPVYVPAEVRVAEPVGLEIRAETDFYEPLTPYGRWEVVGGYGRCWIPGRVGRDWRPYSDGHWVRTEAGWYWASDEPWAWATYHYGRWDLSPTMGWFWVPQTRWAPAWVSWHHGGGYLGWAPLDPTVRVVSERPVEVDVRRIPSRGFVFVEEKRFLDPVRPATVVVNNTTIINNTVNITNLKVVNNTVVNEGPRTQIIEKASGRAVQAVPVQELRRQGEAVAVAARRPSLPAPSERTEVPSRRSLDPRPNPAQPPADERARDLHVKAQAESERNAKELERTAQRQSEIRAKELQKNAQGQAQKAAREFERRAQDEAQQHAKELAQKAQQESQRHAQELQIKAQMAAQQRAKELEKKAQEESQRSTKELERKAQLQAEQRDLELHRKAQDAAQRISPAVPRSPGAASVVPSRRESMPTPSRTTSSPTPTVAPTAKSKPLSVRKKNAPEAPVPPEKVPAP